MLLRIIKVCDEMELFRVVIMIGGRVRLGDGLMVRSALQLSFLFLFFMFFLKTVWESFFGACIDHIAPAICIIYPKTSTDTFAIHSLDDKSYLIPYRGIDPAVSTLQTYRLPYPSAST